MTGPVVPPSANPAPANPAQGEDAKPEEQPKPDIDWKAEARKWETRAKEYKPAADRLAQIEEASKTDQQKQAEALANAQNEATTSTVRALRYEVCDEQDLPLKAARFLTGSTKAEIEEAAKAFKELYGSAGKPATGLPPAPNAGREARKPVGGSLGLEEAQRRFPKPAPSNQT